MTVLAAYQDEYEQLACSFRDLDAKARATAAIAGVFAAANLAFARQIANGVALDEPVAWLIMGGVTLLGASVFCSVFAMRVVQVPVPPPAEAIKEVALDVCRGTASLDESEAADFYAELMFLWSTRTTYMSRRNDAKAFWIQGAQYTLIIAILSALAITVALVVGNPEPEAARGKETQSGQAQEQSETLRQAGGKKARKAPGTYCETHRDEMAQRVRKSKPAKKMAKKKAARRKR